MCLFFRPGFSQDSLPYTIVLTPPTDQSMKYVEVSQTLYRDSQPSYLLNAEGTSSPHITIVQFNCDSPDRAYEVWRSVCKKMKEAKLELFTPLFVGISFIEGVGPYLGTTWVELSVKKGSGNSPIMKLHNTTLEVLKRFHLEPLNAVGSHYRPHLTLARIVMPKQMQTWPKNLLESTGSFRLEFGRSDEKWQYAYSIDVFE